MVIQFGRFVEHDITFSPPTPTSSFLEDVDCNRCVKTHPCFPIMFSPSDPRYINGTECIPFTRSSSMCSQTNPVREQVNMQTSYLDGSQIYGSDNNLANMLRNNTNQLGLLAVNQNFSDHGFAFLPFDENATDQCSMADPSVKGPCFTAGDSRVNKQPVLTALHTLFMREHNRLVTELHELNPNWSGEKLYQEARKIMGAVLQKVTYKDWMPLMLGNEISKELPPYTSYDEDVNPAVANVFPIAFRMGHISHLLAEDYSPTNETSVTPWSTVKDGIDPILRDSLLNKVRQNLLVNGIRTDLTSVIIQRGRDHGIPGYNDWRKFCGLSAPNNLDALADVLMNRELAEKLISLYGTVENIDMSVGGVSEPPVANGRIGKSLTCLFGKQFRRLRDGDSYYYEHSSVFSSAQRRSIESVTLAQIICANTNIKKVPPNVFMANDYSDFMECSNFPVMDLTPWKA
ncbi:hypothetical protein GDO81_006738 [Engystomops pustulosus]|uniref:Peroxidase n=1 Tax=Engystomops pustulosus TaxID=76066 RepID=A0AAV7CZ08_ENGPU|nr:hypothetical protein GDO81_006738 [Engystomops pustulosus]